MDPHLPNKLFATKYCFLILRDESVFFLIISLFFVFFLFFYFVILLLLIFTKTMLLFSFYLIYFFFMKITFIFSCSRMFRNVPECSGMFHVPGFIDAQAGRRRVALAFKTFLCKIERCTGCGPRH